MSAPRPHQPLDRAVALGETPNPPPRAFAWALVKLDGADTAMLHAVDAGSPERMATGMRVRVRWSEQRTGSIQDIACFEPLQGGEP